MIYIADGPSDIPAFSIVNQYGGRTFAVYKPKSEEHFRSVEKLQRQNRVQGIGEACYIVNSLAAMWITNAVNEIAERILSDRDALLKQRVGSTPGHILSDLPEKRGLKRPVASAGSGVERQELKATGTEGSVTVQPISTPPSHAETKVRP
jgi:hypothetical protein